MRFPRGGLLALSFFLGWFAIAGFLNAMLLGVGLMEPHAPPWLAACSATYGAFALFALIQTWQGRRLAVLAFRAWIVVALASQGVLMVTRVPEVYLGGYAGILVVGVVMAVVLLGLDCFLRRSLSNVWMPIARTDLLRMVRNQLESGPPGLRDFYARVRTNPEKWQLHPWGNLGGGFWVVARTEELVVWYNDIEDGFNVSRFEVAGIIPPTEYWCNQDTVKQALQALSHGGQQAKWGPPQH